MTWYVMIDGADFDCPTWEDVLTLLRLASCPCAIVIRTIFP